MELVVLAERSRTTPQSSEATVKATKRSGTSTRLRWGVKDAADRDSAPNSTTATAVSRAYLQGIDNAEIIETVHARRALLIPPYRAPVTLTDTPGRAAVRRAKEERLTAGSRPTAALFDDTVT